MLRVMPESGAGENQKKIMHWLITHFVQTVDQQHMIIYLILAGLAVICQSYGIERAYEFKFARLHSIF